MKKLSTILISLMLISGASMAQNGFIIEYLMGGPMYSINLSNGQKTLVGNTINNFGAGDFGANDVLYAINSITNEFYEIDTLTGATTSIGTITPPNNHMWTGMAYDETNDIMYGYSAYAIAAGEGSLHIIDVTNASYTLVGTQTTATGIGCIAIDGSGQMYGMQEEASADIYQIDTGNGEVTFVGPTGQGAAGMGHGMDWSNTHQTMYLVTYNSFTFANTLRTVNLTTGWTTQVGGYLGGWMGLIAIPSSYALSANFSADVTDVCVGGSVVYTDMSSGATSWSWTFEGGTPATSTDQNPTVIYNSTGVFDVTLEVSDGSTSDTDLVEDMITVTDIPIQPDTPTGNQEVCAGSTMDYETNTIPYAEELVWTLTPPDAGTVIGNGENISIEWSDIFESTAYLAVYGTNDCGDGNPSDALEIEVLSIPEPDISGENIVCRNYEYIYTTIENPGSTFVWDIYGGNISSGAGTSEIIVLWTTAGSGSIVVTETTAGICNGTSETFLVTINDCTGINEIKNNGLKLFPNPTTDKFTISFDSKSIVTFSIEIYNQFGQKVLIKNNINNNETNNNHIDVSALSNGLYIVKIYTPTNDVYTSKIEISN